MATTMHRIAARSCPQCRSETIGLVALAGFTTLSRIIADSTDPVIDIAHEGVAVLGWVSMWKPLEMLLSDWWPVRREQRACRRIADATISFPIESVAA